MGPARTMYLKTHLYVGGYDKRNLLNKGVDVTRGFDGCISGLEISMQKIDMIKDILDAANIQNCGESNDVSNTITDHDQLVDCRPGYAGDSCEKISDVCIAQDPCDNGGICHPNGNEYTCDCVLGYTGDICQYRAPLTISGMFRGNGYVELNRSALVPSSTEKVVLIAVLFSTTQSNGLIAWYGQNKNEAFNGQDFVALAVVDGYVEFSFRLDSEESLIKNIQTRVDDGANHVAILQRRGNQASLELDNLTSYGECRPTDKQKSYLPGHIFIGGAPDLNNFTGSRYTNGFNGCIHVVEGADDGAINWSRNAISGLNVESCPEKEGPDLGPEPPVV